MLMCISWGYCENTASDSLGLGRGPRLCMSNKRPSYWSTTLITSPSNVPLGYKLANWRKALCQQLRTIKIKKKKTLQLSIYKGDPCMPKNFFKNLTTYKVQELKIIPSENHWKWYAFFSLGHKKCKCWSSLVAYWVRIWRCLCSGSGHWCIVGSIPGATHCECS